MNFDECKSFLLKNNCKDEWWVSVDEEMEPAKMNLATLMTKRKAFAGKEVSIMHPTSIGTDDEVWTAFDFDSPKGPKFVLKPKELGVGVGYEKVVERMNGMSEEIASLFGAVNEVKACVIDVSDRMKGWVAMQDESKQLDEKIAQLKSLERSLKDREQYISNCEERLINIACEQEEVAAELEVQREDQSRNTHSQFKVVI